MVDKKCQKKMRVLLAKRRQVRTQLHKVEKEIAALRGVIGKAVTAKRKAA